MGRTQKAIQTDSSTQREHGTREKKSFQTDKTLESKTHVTVFDICSTRPFKYLKLKIKKRNFK